MQALHKQAQRNQASNSGKAAKSSPNPARSGPPSALPFGFGGSGVPPVRPSPQPGLQPAVASVISLKPGSSVVEPFSPEAVTAAAVTTTPTSADSTKSEVTALLQCYSIHCCLCSESALIRIIFRIRICNTDPEAIK